MMNSSVSTARDSTTSTQPTENAGGTGTSAPALLAGEQGFGGTMININTFIESGTEIRLHNFAGKLEQEYKKAVTNTNDRKSTPPSGILDGAQVSQGTSITYNVNSTPRSDILDGTQVFHGTLTNSTTTKSTPTGGILNGDQMVFHVTVTI